MPARLRRDAGFATIVLLLVLSIPAVGLIPFGPFLGLDFHNLVVFHDCAARDNPYVGTGFACGDAAGRDMLYPPLLYWSFVWVRLVPFATGVAIWEATIIVGLLAALTAWVPRGQRSGPEGARLAVFIGLLAFQFPVMFAMERGNNDVLVLIAWTITLRLFVSGRFGAAGFVAGLAAALKLYPVFACVVAGLALTSWAWRDRRGRRPVLLFAGGGASALALAGLAFLEQNVLYLTDQLPRFANEHPEVFVSSHPLSSIAPGGNMWVLGLPLLVVWVIAGTRLIPRDPALAFAGALAISTYFASTTNDYNLMTTYPLLLLLFLRSMRARMSPLSFSLLLLGLVAIVGNRYLFAGSQGAMGLHVALQWLWLMTSGLLAAMFEPRSAGIVATASEEGSP